MIAKSLSLQYLDVPGGRLAYNITGPHDLALVLCVAGMGDTRAHPGRYPLTQRVPDAQDPEHLAAAELAVQTVVAALRGYGMGGDEAIDATRVARSALHGFVSLEIDGGFGLPQDVGRSFERLVSALHASLRDWGDVVG